MNYKYFVCERFSLKEKRLCFESAVCQNITVAWSKHRLT